MDETKTLNIELVKRNALAQHIALQEIAIFYGGLSIDERNCLQELNLLKYESGDTVIATFTKSGEALFPNKINGVHFLGAD